MRTGYWTIYELTSFCWFDYILGAKINLLVLVLVLATINSSSYFKTPHFV